MGKVRGFVVHPTYRTLDNKTYAHLYGRLENGESFLIIDEYKPYFYIKKDDLDKALGIHPVEYEETDFKNFDGNLMVKVFTNTVKELPVMKDILEGITCYESDLKFIQRYMIDKDVCGNVEIDGDYKKEGGIDRVYRNPELSKTDNSKIKLNVLSFDIESDKRGEQIYCISLYTGDYEEVFIVDREGLKGAKSFSTEAELLEAFSDKIQELDPDVIVGWNVIDFDMALLERRFNKFGMTLDFGKDRQKTNLRLSKNFFQSSHAHAPGRIILDGIEMLKGNFIKLQDYKLQTASKELLKDEKLITDEGQVKYEMITNLYNDDPQTLVDYNLKDSILAYKIIVDKGFLDLTMHRSILTGMPLDRIGSSIASLDSLYLREAKARKIVCPSISGGDREERISGGYVMQSVPGIYDGVIVCDFKSLYPSIIRTFNIDPMAFKKTGTIKAPNGARFENTDGILPILIESLWKQRDVAKKKKDDTESYAIKITMNSFYGVLANPNCRFYSTDVANAITSFGRKIIQDTAGLLIKRGYKVIYGDTDSIFINTGHDNPKEVIKIGKDVEKFINSHYDKIVKEDFDRKSFLEIEFDKTYKRFFMPRGRNSETGAKKRYAGLIEKDGKEDIDFTGLEFVRRDWTDLSKKFQYDVLFKVFHKEDVKKYVKDFVQDLKDGKMDDQLIYYKSLRKPLEEYTKTTPPHVKAARKLEKLESSLISYVMTENGPEPTQNLNSKIDYDHYIEKQIRPIADSILVFFDSTFDDILEGSEQTSLLNF